jgi:hypothetical protein
MIEMLIGRGYELKLFDRHVSLAKLVGQTAVIFKIEFHIYRVNDRVSARFNQRF